MNILVIGANGQVGKHLVSFINEAEDLDVRAMVRKKEQKETFEKKNVTAVLADLEDDISSFEEAFTGIDAVVFVAGSGPKTGKDKTITIDLDGAVKTIEAAKKFGVNRYVMVSSFDTSREAIQASGEGMKPYTIAKHFADEWLRDSGLNYTIIHPGGLENEPGTGKVTLGKALDMGSVPREDVAHVILKVLQQNQTEPKEFQVLSGDQPIDQALKSFY